MNRSAGSDDRDTNVEIDLERVNEAIDQRSNAVVGLVRDTEVRIGHTGRSRPAAVIALRERHSGPPPSG
ncbi:hypothetical protein [Natrinema soli]|uniref:Uncharacterized protein n=1 Tax=Natrinema soli TaxID=1930624 RepID=A0ABD5SX78_9EURY|nr:hypothetical protein [Natrinema soli]